MRELFNQRVNHNGLIVSFSIKHCELGVHCRRCRLMSVERRRTFGAPDVCPFPDRSIKDEVDFIVEKSPCRKCGLTKEETSRMEILRAMLPEDRKVYLAKLKERSSS